MITKEKQSKNAIKWIDALLRGNYKQGIGMLGSLEGGFCCWGLGCYLMEIPFDKNASWNRELEHYIGYRGEEEIYVEINKSNYTLVELNDSLRLHFKEIGTLLASYPYHYFNNYVAEKVSNWVQEDKDIKQIVVETLNLSFKGKNSKYTLHVEARTKESV